MIVIAHNIRSLHNIGSIFRNAAAFGVEKLYLTGFSETPPRKEIAKVALGAQDMVPWEKREIGKLIDELHSLGYIVVGLENTEEGVPITTFIHSTTFVKSSLLALVLGNEVDGIEKNVCLKLDALVEIPMKKKKSLNVSVAGGIAMFMLS